MSMALPSLGGCGLLSETDAGPTRLESWFESGAGSAGTTAPVVDQTASLEDEVEALVQAVMADDAGAPMPDAHPSTPVDHGGSIAPVSKRPASLAADNSAVRRPAVPSRGTQGAALAFVSKDAPPSSDNVRDETPQTAATDRHDDRLVIDGETAGDARDLGAVSQAETSPVIERSSPATLKQRQDKHFPKPRWRQEYDEKHAGDPAAHKTPRGF